MNKTHYSCKELAALKLANLPKTKKGWYALVKRDEWQYLEEKTRGRAGGTRLYSPPESIAKLIAKHTGIQAAGKDSRHILETVAAFRAEAVATRNAKTDIAFDDLAAKLTLKGKFKFDAKLSLVLAWRDFFADRAPIGRNESFNAFAATYNKGHLDGIDDRVRKAYRTISSRTIQRWVLENEAKGLVMMADKRTFKGDGMCTIKAYPQLFSLIIATLTEKPHINHTHLLDIINHRRIDAESGEILWPELSYSALNRFVVKWKKDNLQQHTLNTNPDSWKSKFMSSMGRLDGDIVRLNQRWELDGTPADWELIGGRHTASVVIDVWSRRPKILFSKTPRTETNKALMRAAVMEWGIPEDVKTDNGSDYVSREMQIFFEEMQINQIRSAPFSPWEKAHVESFIKTYLHSILELLDNFIGHNVAERKGIEARRTFAEQLFKKNAVVKVDMTVDELQSLTNAWLDGTYMTRDHGTLGISPREKVASWTGPVRRIENERALDVLLFKPVKRMPIITAKGIRYDKADFLHPELPLHAGKEADIRLDPTDAGRLVVRVDGKFLCIAVCPERTGISRAEIAVKGRHLQQEWATEERKRAKARRHGLPSTEAIVKDILLTRARASGKVTMLPKPSQTHDTPALRDAERVASRLAGEFAELDPDAGIITTTDPAINAGPQKVHVIPETAELRYRKWRDLTDRFERGEEITEFDNPQVRRFFQSWPESSEGRALRRRYEAPKPKANPAATGLASLIR